MKDDKKINGKTADEWFNIALDEKDLNKQVEYYSNCLKLNPEDADAWYNKGLALGELERYEDAIKSFEKAIEIDPKNAFAWYTKGVSLGKLERYEDAIKSYEKAIEIDPKYAHAWNNKGVALGELERYEDAIKSYEKAIEIDPKYAHAWYNKGIALGKLERYEDAIKSFEKAIEIDPKYAFAWNNKGNVLHKLRRYEDAIKSYEKAIEIDPKYAHAWSNKGVALGKLERYEDAIKVFEKAIEIDPKNAFAWNNKGVALGKLERYEDAIKVFEGAIKIDPKNEIVKRILKLAKKILSAEEELKHAEKILIAEEELKHAEFATERRPPTHTVIPIPNIKKHPVVRLCLVQLDFQITDRFPYQLETKDVVKKKILKALKVATEKKVNIICFPELSFAEEFISEVKNYKDMIIVGGSYYDDNFNICPVIINGEVYPVYKIHPSLHEQGITIGKGMKSGKDIKIFKSKDGRFKFAVLICIDYLEESNRLYRYQKGINFIFNPSFNPDSDSFQKQADLDCKYHSVTLIQTNVKEYGGKEYGGTCIIGVVHNDTIKQLINEGYKKPNDPIKYKLCEAEGEMMIIVDFNLEEVRVTTPLDASPRIRIIGQYKYENGCWQEYKSDH